MMHKKVHSFMTQFFVMSVHFLLTLTAQGSQGCWGPLCMTTVYLNKYTGKDSYFIISTDVSLL